MGNGAHLVYQGPLGQILCEGASFFASEASFCCHFANYLADLFARNLSGSVPLHM